MFDGRYARYLVRRTPETVRELLGNRSLDDFVEDMRFDAANLEQIEAVAAAILDRKQHISHKPTAAAWKKAWRVVKADADAMRERLAAVPNRETHPGFFDNRTVGRPGQLYDDLHLPLVARLDLSGLVTGKLGTGCYSDPLHHDRVYRLQGTRDLKVRFTPEEGGLGVLMDANVVRGLLSTGRLVAMPLSALRMAA
jgi:hypothetical protein